MRFVRVTFRCFGPFEEQSLDLAGPGGLHVVFGPNEAGKKLCTPWFGCVFLFGFPPQSRDDFRFKYSQFRVRAQCSRIRPARRWNVTVRKGNKATLRMIDDRTEIPESIPDPTVGGLAATAIRAAIRAGFQAAR